MWDTVPDQYTNQKLCSIICWCQQQLWQLANHKLNKVLSYSVPKHPPKAHSPLLYELYISFCSLNTLQTVFCQEKEYQ